MFYTRKHKTTGRMLSKQAKHGLFWTHQVKWNDSASPLLSLPPLPQSLLAKPFAPRSTLLAPLT